MRMVIDRPRSPAAVAAAGLMGLGLVVGASPGPLWAQASKAKGTVSATTPRANATSPNSKDADTDSNANTNANANANTKGDDAPEAGREKPPSLFGDAEKFTRMGGWGGIGASMGQWGFGKSMLIMMPPVQEELKLSEAQVRQLKEWSETMRDRGRALGEQMRGQNPDVMVRRDISIAAAAGMVFQMMGQMNQLIQENESGIARILTPKQRTRLNQISLQMEGITALGRPEVANALYLNPWQREKIAEALALLKTRQVFYWIGQGRQMIDRFGPNGQGPASQTETGSRADAESPTADSANPDRSQAAQANRDRDRARDRDRVNDDPSGSEPVVARDRDDPDAEDAEARRAERARREKLFRTEFERMRSDTDKMQEEVVESILKKLTPRQRSAFDKMLGPPFDPKTIEDGFRRMEQDRRRERERDRDRDRE